MSTQKWESQRVQGRDELLRDILKRANSQSEAVVKDVRMVMQDYEVDMYRLVLSIGNHYGMEKAYQIMSETVAVKRLRWLDQVLPELVLKGTVIESGLEIYRKYFKLNDESFHILEQTQSKVVFKRIDFIDAIAYACDALGLDVIEVNNKVYAKTMNLLFQKLKLNLINTVLEYQNGWYNESIEINTNR
jgi:hypothetical protein